MTHERDEWLMSQAALGNQCALEPLVRRYANPLLTFIRRMVGDEHRSEELFRDVFVAVWMLRKQYVFVPDDRQAGDRDPLAPRRLQAVLAM
jgi:DNA-directed RNA polymerase specialized sigma24 family protein